MKGGNLGLKVAVIIPSLNEEKHIESLLRSLRGEKYKNKEIILVDGGSTDNTIKIAKKYGARVVKETGNKSPANARNLGASSTDAALLSFFDADKLGVN
ncbi:MAG: glycosyltransferase, partial [Candidatus Micrarchaeota archaeon]|nr:glycosyltransferase [Candidatus Micrarchaeota archaeon]